ncbi:diacylglycerol/lipid kinase family protein [candidate division KSB1 bacterium]
MNDRKIEVIATTISGSVSDWGKVKRIVPLFDKHGFGNVALSEVDAHAEARKTACECIRSGSRLIISAGGSGTFNSVLEGCCDSDIDLGEITLGFLRKGSADLIGKTLGMPDEIEEAVSRFADSINAQKTVKCDVILAESEEKDAVPRHFVGYAGAEIFGEIPYFTENRFIKYYKGILGQLFGDMGPFFVGASLACVRKQLQRLYKPRKIWRIVIDGEQAVEDYFQAFIIVNGDLGKDLPLARSVPLGSGDFYLFALKDMGVLKLTGQFKHTWDASILDDPLKWGFGQYCIKGSLRLIPDTQGPFHANIDGSTMVCRKSVNFRIVDSINLLTA